MKKISRLLMLFAGLFVFLYFGKANVSADEGVLDGSISLNEEKVASIAESESDAPRVLHFYTFTPESSGWYAFYSKCEEEDPFGELWYYPQDNGGEGEELRICANDDGIYTNQDYQRNFWIQAKLEAGKNYRIGASFLGEKGGKLPFTVTKIKCTEKTMTYSEGMSFDYEIKPFESVVVHLKIEENETYAFCESGENARLTVFAEGQADPFFSGNCRHVEDNANNHIYFNTDSIRIEIRGYEINENCKTSIKLIHDKKIELEMEPDKVETISAPDEFCTYSIHCNMGRGYWYLKTVSDDDSLASIAGFGSGYIVESGINTSQCETRYSPETLDVTFRGATSFTLEIKEVKPTKHTIAKDGTIVFKTSNDLMMDVMEYTPEETGYYYFYSLSEVAPYQNNYLEPIVKDVRGFISEKEDWPNPTDDMENDDNEDRSFEIGATLEKGKTYYIAVCAFQSGVGEIKTRLVKTDQHEHDYKVTTVESSCSSFGYKKHVCKICKRDYITDLKGYGHNLEDLDSRYATCTEPGITTNCAHCTKCGKYFYSSSDFREYEESEVITPALGHDWGEWEVTVEPTEDSEGEAERYCRNDGSHKETKVLDKVVPYGDIIAFVKRLYLLCLGREADEGGLNFWKNALVEGTYTGASSGAHFFLGSEFESFKYSDEEFLNRLYQAMMDRDPDQGGMDYWSGLLKSGVGRQYVLNGFIQSPEFGSICEKYGIVRGRYIPDEGSSRSVKLSQFVGRLYVCTMKRSFDRDGINFWCNALYKGEHSITSMCKFFYMSDEFKSFETDNVEYVNRLYATFFGRTKEEDPSGFEFWTGALDDGTWTRERVLDFFIGSDEFKGIKAEFGL
ncbi:MAG: DUF4214 domain-containing protein [Lachnospiraceae bacterium]|nr:DUF4214 domain-containing protein [Lachnospiraceae bacterium]